MALAWPESPAAIAMKKLQRMVALSDSFQTRAAIDYDTALSRVFYEYVPTKDEMIREAANSTIPDPIPPFASVWPMALSFNPVAGGSQVWTIANGMMHLYLMCEPLVTEVDWNDKRSEAIGFLNQWLADVMELSGADDAASDDGMGHLTITQANVELIDHVPFKDRSSVGDFYYMSASLTIGDQ